MNTTVVCISSVDGAESRGIGDLVADRLGFRVADGGIIVAVAQAEGLLPESVALAESRGAGRTLAVDFARVERTERLRELIRASIGQAAVEGNVVIVAHAASYALAARDGVLRVLVTASNDTRISRIAAAEGIDAGEAAKRLAEGDKGRAVYLERFYNVKRELPTDYDLVLNTDRISAEEAAAVIVNLCRERDIAGVAGVNDTANPRS